MKKILPVILTCLSALLLAQLLRLDQVARDRKTLAVLGHGRLGADQVDGAAAVDVRGDRVNARALGHHDGTGHDALGDAGRGKQHCAGTGSH